MFKTRIYDHDREQLVYWMASNIGPLNRTSGISVFYGEDWEIVTGTIFLRLDNGNPPKKVYRKYYDVTIMKPAMATFFNLKWS
jgi:hypothetical protein